MKTRKYEWRVSIYGYWTYDDTIGVAGLEKDDIIYVYSRVGDTVHYIDGTGKVGEMHVTHATKGCVRDRRNGHKPAKCRHKGTFGLDCELCYIWRQKYNIKKKLIKG